MREKDLQVAVAMLPSSLKEFCQQKGKDLVIAGGYLRAIVNLEEVKDIDLFCPTPETAKKFYEELFLLAQREN